MPSIGDLELKHTELEAGGWVINNLYQMVILPLFIIIIIIDNHYHYFTNNKIKYYQIIIQIDKNIYSNSLYKLTNIYDIISQYYHTHILFL